MGFRHIFLFCAVAFAVSEIPAPAYSQALPELHRGLNLSSWLANAPRQPVFSRDFAEIRRVGFDHVRLPFNPEYYGFKLAPDFGQSDQANIEHINFTELDRALAAAAQYKMPVILDLHPSSEFVDNLEQYPWAEDEVIALWKAIAERYKNKSSDVLLFELLNEPQYYKHEQRWTNLVQRLTRTIRSISSDRVLIVGAPHGSEIDGLPYLQTSPDRLTIYAFHFYEPYVVTHQGIHMGFEKKMIKAFRNLPYPSELATKSSATYAPDAKDPAEALNELIEYTNTPWNADHIADRISIAQNWAVEHKAHLLCGEFGVLRNHIDPASRYRWINDTRAALDRDNIGWELWDYTDLFGVAAPQGKTSTDPVDGSIRLDDPATGSRQFEPAALKALGLPAASGP